MSKQIRTTAAAATAALALIASASGTARAQQKASPAPPTVVDLRAGRLRVTMGPESGRMRMTVDGVPVVTDSHLYLVKPGWTGIYLNTDSTKPTISVSEENGAKVATAVFENEDAYARYRFEPRAGSSGNGGDAVTVRVAYGTKKGQPAELEYAAGYLNANPLAGVPFQADTVEGPRSGAAPAFATSSDQVKSRLTPFFRRMRLDSRLGPLTITAEGSGEANRVLNLFDARGETAAWATRHPIFWLGLGSPARPIAPGENTVTVTYAVGPAPARTPLAAAPSLSGKPGAVVSIADARVPFVADRPLIPLPKEVKAGSTPLRLGAGSRIVLPAAPSEEEKRAAEEVREELKNFWSLDVSVVTGGAARAGDIRLGKSLAALAPPAQTEGYALAVGGGGATISGTDGRGVYHGAQTLKQLLRVDARGVYVQPVTVRDWPTFAWRGVHWFGGPRSYPFHEQMIERIIAPLKYNTMVYEVDYTQWASQPKIWSPTLSTPKADVKHTVDLARAHLLEPIPLLNALGHMEWLFVGKQNLDIAADTSRPYAIDPENPRTYEVLLPIIDEAIDLFRPKTLHIGHDEVSLFGTFPKKGSKKTETELFLENIGVLHGHLKKKNVRTMLWGDMMLHSSEGSGGAAYATSTEESAARRAGVPKDVLIADWHYAGPDYPSTSLFKREGFESVAGTWLDPSNIRGFARQAARDGASGLLQTTWAGYAMSPEIVRGESFAQFVAYLTAAEHAWNGGANEPLELGYSPDEAFLALWNRQPAARTSHRGFAVDLAPAANADFWDWAAGGGAAPTAFPIGADARLGGVRFHTGRRAVWLHGALNPAGAWPRAVTLPLGDAKKGRKASSLEWLIGTTYATPTGTRVATVTVTYADGKTEVVPLTYGREVFAFTDARSGPEATPVWNGRAGAGPVRVRRWTWKNPRPAVAIARVVLSSEGTEAAPVLLGLTGIE
ncbi:MAG TPA: beta-N-acetylhexosaminidase [Armatimonadaceae bacterium]|nr:beta-N-acetylhexosaminidase [Armatimonadaceae bacterium]